MFTKTEEGHDMVLAPEFGEFTASWPTSTSTMHDFLLTGRSGMPKNFLIHLNGLFLR